MSWLDCQIVRNYHFPSVELRFGVESVLSTLYRSTISIETVADLSLPSSKHQNQWGVQYIELELDICGEA